MEVAVPTEGRVAQLSALPALPCESPCRWSRRGGSRRRRMLPWPSAERTPQPHITCWLREVLDNGSLYFPPFPAQMFRTIVHAVAYRCRAANAVGVIVSRDCTVRAGSSSTCVSIMEIQPRHVKVIGSSERRLQGGQSVDEKLFARFEKEYKRQTGKLFQKKQYIMLKCRQIKEEICEEKGNVSREYTVSDGENTISVTMTKKDVTDFCSDLVDLVVNEMKDLLMLFEVECADVGCVLIVGGSSRIPLLRECVTESFDDKATLIHCVNPEEAVVKGAALIGSNTVTLQNVLNVTTVVKTPTTSTTIPRGTPLPYKTDSVFCNSGNVEVIQYSTVYSQGHDDIECVSGLQIDESGFIDLLGFNGEELNICPKNCLGEIRRVESAMRMQAVLREIETKPMDGFQSNPIDSMKTAEDIESLNRQRATKAEIKTSTPLRAGPNHASKSSWSFSSISRNAESTSTGHSQDENFMLQDGSFDGFEHPMMGFKNLGNTCYIIAALQHCRVAQEHFKTYGVPGVLETKKVSASNVGRDHGGDKLSADFQLGSLMKAQANTFQSCARRAS
ncbi:uncharacterized protein LOC113214695 isoform X2 [Frankliniella occidentalis]|uniref:Uncharacterized protein LOC113214695 isoform X2 n=1 Tax=Frankliniella occidentalis TaxID=133901 RepID=A0A9C6UC38_FRAOC|nr:uncharacterized protein LOC113214695 isoform X2 [Frankliniella occidentalis]